MIDALLNNFSIIVGAVGALTIALLTTLGTKFIEKYLAIRPAFSTASTTIGPNLSLKVRPANRAARKKRDLGLSLRGMNIPDLGKLHVEGSALSWSFDLSEVEGLSEILEDGKDYPIHFFFDANHQSEPTLMRFKAAVSSVATRQGITSQTPPAKTHIETTSQTGIAKQRGMRISEEEFFEFLGQRNSELPAALKTFLGKAKALGVYADMQGGLNLKHPSPVGNAFNFGTIRKDAYVDTSPSTWWERTAIGHRYNEVLANCLGGTVQTIRGGKESAVRTARGSTPLLSDLLPQHEEIWLQTIRRYIDEATASAGRDRSS